jgi:predicted transposase/invertase (TIGR01784 family)
MKFADPKNDIAFKKIFGDEHQTEVLISFLNSILEFNDNKAIKSITIANPYQITKIEALKDTILDVKAINQDNEEFIVEMQVQRDIHFVKRSLYYSSKSYVNQIEFSDKYPELKKVYFIGILDFAIFDTSDYLSKHLILDEKTFKQEMQDFEFNFIELKKFKLQLSECNTLAKKWIYFIQNANTFELIPKEFEDIDTFKTAFEIAKKYKWSKEELDVYDNIDMKKGSINSALETAKLDGIEQGIEQEKFTIAKNLKQAGVTFEIIMQTTGFSLKEIENL